MQWIAERNEHCEPVDFEETRPPWVLCYGRWDKCRGRDLKLPVK